jgi:transposase
MGSRVELFEQIRRDRDREGLSIRAPAARHGVHRRAVRQALASPLPPVKRSPAHRPAPKLGAYRALIDGSSTSTVPTSRRRRSVIYVRARKRAMGWPAGEVFVPQAHAPGAEAEVDWGQAQVELAGTATRVHLFLMRASFSGATFCQASLVETQQAFLELHAQAFGWWRARPAPPSRGAGRGAGLLRQRRPGCGRLRRGASDARMGRRSGASI